MNITYDKKYNKFILSMDSDDLASIRYALGNEVERQESTISYLKHMLSRAKPVETIKDGLRSAKKQLKEIKKVSEELEKITLKWARKKHKQSNQVP